MPTYEYACRECGEHLEVVQGFKDAPLTECGRCGGQLRKVFSAAGIIFKGSGYYVTDSRTSGAPPAAAKASADPATSDASGSGTNDTASGKDTSTSADSSASKDSSAHSA